MKSNQDRRAYWQEQMGLWESSGLAQREFCEANRLFLSSFSQWRQKFRQENTSAVTDTLASNFVPARLLGSNEEAVCRLGSRDGREIVLPARPTTECIA